MVVAEKLQVQGFHYPFPGSANVEKDGNGYRVDSGAVESDLRFLIPGCSLLAPMRTCESWHDGLDHLDENRARPYSRAHDQRRDHTHRRRRRTPAVWADVCV